MKLLETSRDDLLLPLQTVSGIVERRHTLPILSNVLIERGADAWTLLATDLEIQVSCKASIGSQAATSAITTSARKLQDILRRLHENGLEQLRELAK